MSLTPTQRGLLAFAPLGAGYAAALAHQRRKPHAARALGGLAFVSGTFYVAYLATVPVTLPPAAPSEAPAADEPSTSPTAKPTAKPTARADEEEDEVWGIPKPLFAVLVSSLVLLLGLVAVIVYIDNHDTSTENKVEVEYETNDDVPVQDGFWAWLTGAQEEEATRPKADTVPAVLRGNKPPEKRQPQQSARAQQPAQEQGGGGWFGGLAAAAGAIGGAIAGTAESLGNALIGDDSDDEEDELARYRTASEESDEDITDVPL
mmetsp:Transcript_1072/g.2726  ORF Transcript_1072/g.2726 Transcript_1072/m.2726 type:complete len:262 (-) Transcript_1072:432-1217(-)